MRLRLPVSQPQEAPITLSRPLTNRWAPRLGALALVAGLLIVSACGSGGGETSQPTPVSIEVSGKGKDVKVKAPESVKGGLAQIDLKNVSDGPRDAQLVRVEGDHKPQEFVKLLERQGGPIPDWVQDGGGIGTTPPGQTRSATQNLAEGNYIIASIPEGEEAPTTAEFKVEGGSEGELPETTGEIVAKEYSFDADGLKPGKQKIKFENEGQELHHAIGAPLRPGKTLEDVKKFLSEEGGGDQPSGPPPIDEQSGFNTAVIDGGISQVVDVDLKPGKYALICFIQDRKGGPPHAMMGMIKEVEVQ